MENLNSLQNELLQFSKANANAVKVTEAEEIILAVCQALNVGFDDLTSVRKNSEFVEARQIAFKILRDKKHNCDTIGDLFNRDHSTVLYGVKCYEDKIYTKDRSFLQKVALVAEEMEGLCA
ncbi:chromosomal replication initiation ATPase DnaA [Pedobacter sp. UYEF25]